MSRRIDIELTSTRPDGSWTWRAAGAKQPKGVVEGEIVPGGSKVGDVLRVEADFEIDGIIILSVLPSKEPRAARETIELIPRSPAEELVTTSLVPKRERPPGRRPDRGDRPDRPDRDRRDAGRDRRPGGRDRREGAPDRAVGDAPRGPRPASEGRGPRPATGPRPPRPARERAAVRPRAEGVARAAAEDAPAKPKPKRLNPANTHRRAVLESLPPEQRAIAEQVLRGGVAAVRQAVEAQNAQRAEGEPAIKPEPLVAMAEDLLPRLKTAEWRDRADAAVAQVDDISIRDLRSVVASADVAARDDDTRLLASTLRQALDRRLQQQRDDWVQELTKSLDDQRLIRALRIASRPPDPATRLPAEVAVRLSESAGAAMTPDASCDRWTALLEAVAASPVRRTVKPVGLPAEPGEPLLQLAKQTAGRVPALASLLGIDMPPPPGPLRRPPPKPLPPRPVPPPPPTPPAAAAQVEPAAALAPPARPAPAAEVEPAPLSDTAEKEEPS